MRTIALIFFGLFTLFVSCDNDVAVAPVVKKGKQTNKLVDFNKDYIGYESRAIDTLIQIKQWEVQKTNTGLRYILEPKDCSGYKPVAEDIVKLSYTVSDIHGKLFYDVKDTIVHLEKDYTVNGLVEGLKMMCIGSEATFVLPSYLGYDIKGDKKKIGSKEVLIYQVKVNNIIKNRKK